MSKIRIGVYGPTGKMGASVIDQLKNFKNFELVSLCEEKITKLEKKFVVSPWSQILRFFSKI